MAKSDSVNQNEELNFLAVHAPVEFFDTRNLINDHLNAYMPKRDVTFNERPPNLYELEYIKCARRYQWAQMMLNARSAVKQMK